MPQVDRKRVKERAARLRAKGDDAHTHFLAKHRDAEIEILMESDGVGRTPHFAEVAVGRGLEAGALHRARIDGHDGRRLTGKVVA